MKEQMIKIIRMTTLKDRGPNLWRNYQSRPENSIKITNKGFRNCLKQQLGKILERDQ